MPTRLIVLAALLALAVTSASRAETQAVGKGYAVLYQNSWRTGIDPRIQLQEPSSDAIVTVPVPEFGGVALRTSMRRSDDFSHIANAAPRVEMSFTRLFSFSPGNEYEMRWSTMIPPGYPLDHRQSEIITQIHQSDSDIGSPPVALMLTGNQYQVDVRGDVSLQPAHSFLFGSPLSDEGRVVSWLLRYRPDDTGKTSVTDLYKDGVLVMHAGAVPNAYPGDKHAYLKLGIYKWWWKTRPSEVDERRMYYGNLQLLTRPATTDSLMEQS
ncbi:polysaccharide lyase-like protein [Paraburkholderia sp. BL6665CI2N2]|uniref:heparin lyase I family protein n=1 Tax=Paraburkholderia sp. BL6665CI2N2 TaxID=1938806 RepID=UPI0010655A4F|nr:heparin lyase I family protein [Paraburkholderia sp. BL6665CI2N2]TDY16886.1 polysaccharide lyase-like protein [Paraburkholderia sp. BL6665CI2N2]